MIAAIASSCAIFCSCGDSDESGTINIETPTTAIMYDVDAEKYLDATYAPSLSEVQYTWVGDYEGWDSNQEKNTKIKRLLTLKPNNHYTNIIRGILVESGKNEYTDFEQEEGTYVYNERTQTITYTVESDKILDYEKNSLNEYNGKKYYDRIEGNYTEKVQFSAERNGQRSWITRDTYLQSLTDKSINIAFLMVREVENK